MTSRARPAAAVVALMLATAACGGDGPPATAGQDADEVTVAARAFLDTYVEADGRVVRRDQGGDTVSEGVSYALLLAQVADDEATERRVWRWAQEHLQRDDTLLAFLTDARGVVTDDQPATDADLVVAWALSRSDDPDLRAQAPRIVDAVQQHTLITTSAGPVLAAGPWATGDPATLNPSYWVLPALRGLDLDDVADTVPAALDQITPGTAVLPPDWARSDGGNLSATADPAGLRPDVRHGLDAQRLTVWLAVDCAPGSRRLAASYAPLLRERPEAVSRGQDGAVREADAHPLGLVAAAASADAAGDPDARDELLDRAAALDRREPTYYGSAWVALGRALLQSERLDECAETS